MLFNGLYLIALALVSPVVLYRRIRHGRYRRGVGQKLFGVSAAQARRLLGSPPESGHGGGCLWMHAVSVGEVNLLAGLVTALKQQRPDLRIVVSSSTDTGFDRAVAQFGSERVFFCPLDFSWAVARTLKHLRPQTLVLAELELWPNLIRLSRQAGTEVIVANGRLSARSGCRYRRFGWLTRPIFRSIGRVLAQDAASAEQFRRCGTNTECVSVSGSLKFDDAPRTRETVEVQRRIRWAGIDPWHTVWLVGSTAAGEERMALEIYRRVVSRHPELRLILVPRHPERFEAVASLIEQYGLEVHRRSRDPSMADHTWQANRVVLVDTIGELRHWWGVASLATVGGSFGNRGGQNMLEPAGYGCAISFGPDTRNFSEIASRLLESDGAVRVRDTDELQEFVERCLEEVPAADALGRAARMVVQSHRGATGRTVQAILECEPALAQHRAA